MAGGIETCLLRFLQLFGSRLSVVVIVKSDDKGDLYNDYLKTGVEIIHLKTGYLNLKAWMRLYKFFRHEKFNTICDMGANFAGIPLTVARIAGVKKRVAFYRQSSHHFPATRLNIIYANFVNWLVYQNATTILANSRHALNFYFGKKTDNRCRVIKNGVNRELFEINENRDTLRTYFGLPKDKVIIGHTGRVTPAKNHQTIIEVARRICANHTNVVFVLAGNGTQDLCRQEGVIALDYCPEIPKLLKTFDLYYFPSVTEGQPNSLIEAMIAGLPFVASDIPPIKECVPEYNYAQLVSATDVDASVQKIEEIMMSNNKSNYCCKVWAMDEYDAQKNFNQFYNELI
jgi:glycosyltransferase involved in cell wall biosynthesis